MNVTEGGDFDFRCGWCGKAFAVRFELLPAGVARRRDRDNPARDVQKPWLYVWNFERYGDAEVGLDTFNRLLSALGANDWQAVHNINWRYAVPWCRECDRLYCLDHWTIEYGDDPYCSEWGTCPRGHGKILDD